MTRSPGGTTAEQILTRLDAGHRLVVQQGAAEPASAGWDADPTPLAPRRLLPPFPVDAFPPWMAEQVIAVAEFTQTRSTCPAASPSPRCPPPPEAAPCSRSAPAGANP